MQDRFYLCSRLPVIPPFADAPQEQRGGNVGPPNGQRRIRGPSDKNETEPYKPSRNFISAASSRHRFLPRLGLGLSNCVPNRSGVNRR